MKRKMKVFTLTLLIISLFASVAFASSTSLTVDGVAKKAVMETKQGRTYIASSSLKNFGLEATVNGNIATVKNSNVVFKFTVNTNKVKVNNTDFTLDSKTYKKGQEIYLPLRFIFETLGYEIKWDNSTKSIKAVKQAKITYPISFESNGEKYTVSKEPKTIVSLAPDVTETLYAIGAGDKLIGRTKYCNYPEKAKALIEVGSMRDPNIEVIMDINPEMVIAATHYKEEVLNKLKEGKISVVAKESPSSIEEMYDYTLKLGAIVNKDYEARALVSSMRAKVSTVKMYTKNVSSRPSAYYVVGTGQYGEYTAGKDTFIAEAIRVAGGRNAADDVTGWKYSIEKLIDNNPDVIFGPQDAYDTMTSSDNYKSLKAIKNKKYVVVNRDIFSRPSPRLINQGLKILVEMFHKDLVKALNF